MSDMPIEDQDKLQKLGLILLEKLSKDDLRTLSLAHDCGHLDIIMDNEVNPQVVIDFPEDFVIPLSVGDDIDDVMQIKGKKDQTAGYFDLIAGRDGSRDELEDIEDRDVVDKMILDGDVLGFGREIK